MDHHYGCCFSIYTGRTNHSSCSTFTNSSTSHQFGEFFIKTTRFNLIISRLTTNTYALIVIPPGESELQCTRLNLLDAKGQFAQLDGLSDRRLEKAIEAMGGNPTAPKPD